MPYLSSCPINRLQHEPLSAAGLTETDSVQQIKLPLLMFCFHVPLSTTGNLFICISYVNYSQRLFVREVTLSWLWSEITRQSPPPPSGLSDDQETAAEFIQEGAGTQGGDTERD